MIYDYPSKFVLKYKNFSIVWLFPNLDIVTNPSIRRRYKLHRFLLENCGIHSEIIVKKPGSLYDTGRTEELFEYLEKFDVVVLFNVDEEDFLIAQRMHQEGKIALFDHCEAIFNLAHETPIMSAVAGITCSSTALARSTEKFLEKNLKIDKPIFVIRDAVDEMVEKDLNRIWSLRQERFKSDFNVAVSMGISVGYVTNFLIEVCAEAGYELIIISSPEYGIPAQIVQWTPYTWIDDMMQNDVALCCHLLDTFPDKSNIKITAAMSLGMPVIASPLEAYKEAVIDNYDGILVDNDKARWVECLNRFKDKDLRRTFGCRAFQSSFNLYRQSILGFDFLSAVSILLK